MPRGGARTTLDGPPYYFQAVVADDPMFATNATLSGGLAVTVTNQLPPLATITGRVTDQFSRPVPGATVLFDGGRFVGLTGPDGRYEIREVPLGPHTVSVFAPGIPGLSGLSGIPLNLRDTNRNLTLILIRGLPGVGACEEC